MIHLCKYFCVFLLLLSSCSSSAQRDIRLMFYNVENLFDTTDDPFVNDNEYLPDGSFNWTYKRYNQKLQNIYKVIAAIGEWSPPEIIAMCEVENKAVLNDLLVKTPLSKNKYDIVHYNSPDPRGIDVALLYRSDKLSVITTKYIPVVFPKDWDNKTRNILWVTFQYNKKETFNVFVNHWPSRRSGQNETDDLRLWTSRILKSKTDSIISADINAKIIITGDFNDEPTDESLVKGLKVSTTIENPAPGYLYNLSTQFIKDQKTGTIKHQGKWMVFDQIIVSGSLLSNKTGLSAATNKAKVFNAPFILQNDKRNLGFMPYRTYSGRKYLGGFSDHLPVYIDLSLRK